MFNFLKKTPPASDSKLYPLGAISPIEDNRAILFSQVHTPIAVPDSYITDTSGFPQFNQGWLGTCVAHAFVFAKMVLDRIETGFVKVYSRRFLYSLARITGFYNNDSDDLQVQGLRADDAAKAICAVGTVMDNGQDDNNLPHSKYVKDYKITKEMRDQANEYRAGGFTRVLINPAEIEQAVFQRKAVPITINIDWEKIDIDGTVHAPEIVYGFHEVTIIGFEKHPSLYTKRFIFENWWPGWGTEGRGYINYDEVGAVILEAKTLSDIPNDLVLRAKGTQYIFLTTLRFGMNSDAVKELQKRLQGYGLFEGGVVDGRFGAFTNSALMQWQKLNGLVADGIFGPQGRAIMNTGSVPGKEKSKIDLWCQEIEKIEKAKPELHNPGNIKFFAGAKSSQNAVGKDYRGICIYPNDQVGYMALRDLLVRAASGQSSSYFPEMTLYEFYAGIAPYNKYPGYAPASDRNQPNLYAESVARGMGVSPQIRIKDLL